MNLKQIPNFVDYVVSDNGDVFRVSANYYEHTTFGLSVLNGDFSAPVSVAKLKAKYDWLGAYRTAICVENQSLKAELAKATSELEEATQQVEIAERGLAASVLEKMELVGELEAARKVLCEVNDFLNGPTAWTQEQEDSLITDVSAAIEQASNVKGAV